MATDIDALLRQRAELKRRDPGAILLFRVDDSESSGYRAFASDYDTIEEVCGDLKVRYHFDVSGPVPWISFPADGLERVLARLVAAGKRAAVCEPVAGPAPSSGPGGEPVERLVTPGKIEEVTHRITLGYTIDDDGIWLECTCGFRECLGYSPGIMAAFKAARSHHEEALIEGPAA